MPVMRAVLLPYLSLICEICGAMAAALDVSLSWYVSPWDFLRRPFITGVPSTSPSVFRFFDTAKSATAAIPATAQPAASTVEELLDELLEVPLLVPRALAESLELLLVMELVAVVPETELSVAAAVSVLVVVELLVPETAFEAAATVPLGVVESLLLVVEPVEVSLVLELVELPAVPEVLESPAVTSVVPLELPAVTGVAVVAVGLAVVVLLAEDPAVLVAVPVLLPVAALLAVEAAVEVVEHEVRRPSADDTHDVTPCTHKKYSTVVVPLVPDERSRQEQSAHWAMVDPSAAMQDR